ncbi:MAG: hypothetical protein ACE5EF_01690 [Dehalococcoidia bacterium]
MTGEELAAGPVTVASFDLPDGSRQGKGRWYLLQLSLDLQLEERPSLQDIRGRPPVYVSAAVDGAVAFQLKLEAAEGAEPGDEFRWSTYGLVHGPQEGLLSAGGTAHIEFTNYVQTRSVHPGAVPLSFELDGPDQELIRSLTVLPLSGLVLTAEGPPSLRITAKDINRESTPGEDNASVLLLVEVDGKAVSDASVTVLCLDADDELSCDETAKPVDGGYEATVPLGAGEPPRLLVSAAGAGASGMELLTLETAGGGGPRPWGLPALIVGGVLLAGGALLPVARGGDRRPRRRDGTG